jgi:hypothetical protein
LPERKRFHELEQKPSKGKEMGCCGDKGIKKKFFSEYILNMHKGNNVDPAVFICNIQVITLLNLTNFKLAIRNENLAFCS